MDMTWTKLKTFAAGLVAAALACGLGLAAGRLRADDPPPPAPDAKRTQDAAGVALQPPARVKPGHVLTIEVLEALPGRPISGERLVRPDGTISLGYYGDLKVEGLNRDEIKVKVVEHLRRFLRDETLGLIEIDPTTGEERKVAPADTDQVFVDDTPVYDRQPIPLPTKNRTTIQPGDFLEVEVLEALPGRSISGLRLVQPDGTISLGFYGEVPVAGLTRKEVKVKVIEHLRKYIRDEILGLFGIDPATEKMVKIDPADSDVVFVDESRTYRMKPVSFPAQPGPTTVQPGDRLLIEVLEALPGRPIGGERRVRPDGTVSLGFYGDLKVAGLTRKEIKIKVVEHLRKFLSDKQLGLGEEIEPEPGKWAKTTAADTTAVFVQDDLKYWPAPAPEALDRARNDSLREMRDQMERLTREVEALKRIVAPNERKGADPRLNRLSREAEGLKRGRKR
jgi:protein involved in polysaccharide export with SLBB domain